MIHYRPLLAKKLPKLTHHHVNAWKEFTVAASVENIDKVIDFVNAELERNGCPPELLNHIDLAVEEIFVNIANYAYTPTSGDATINITVGEDAVIRFEDSGKFFNPLEHPDPDLDKPLMEREIGGLGIVFVKKTMDKVDYRRIGNKNVLTITKKFPVNC